MKAGTHAEDGGIIDGSRRVNHDEGMRAKTRGGAWRVACAADTRLFCVCMDGMMDGCRRRRRRHSPTQRVIARSHARTRDGKLLSSLC